MIACVISSPGRKQLKMSPGDEVIMFITSISSAFKPFRPRVTSEKWLSEMPTVIRMPKEQVHRGRKNRNGFNIGCFRVCTCMHLGFLTSKSGMLKIFQLLLGSCCETLLINFGARELSATAYQSFLTTVTACLSTTFILSLCYTLSARSYSLIRQSLFVRLSIKTKRFRGRLRLSEFIFRSCCLMD